jgi:hypothetical protein
MNDDLERMWKEVLMSESRYYLGICLEGLRKTAKTSASIQAEIHAVHLPNTSLDQCVWYISVDDMMQYSLVTGEGTLEDACKEGSSSVCLPNFVSEFLKKSSNQKHSDLKTLDKKNRVLNQVSCLVNWLFLFFNLN